MRDVAAKEREWWDAGLPFVRATVVSTWGSAPLPVGSVMLIGPGEEVVGGVSGGCVEGDVLEAASEVLASGEARTLRYGVSDDDAHAVGLTCGGDIEVFVERVSAADPGAAPRTDAAAGRLIVFGASEIAVALTRLGRLMGRRVTLCDARAAFAQAERFPEADEVVVDWPHRYLAAQDEAGLLDGRTAVAVLTHDPKFDVPVLALALRLRQRGRLGYVGLLASRRTLVDRRARLAEEGVGPVALGLLRSPIGLDIGAKGPAEIAISIAAGIIADRSDG
ncbi:MAG: XdhC family protein [Actinomycetota bacterium]